jgi:uncharacterized phiE125 gp8 family phage protein
MSGHLHLVAGPAVEPVTLDEIKAHARIDGTDEDVYLAELITGARELVCRLTGRALTTETWALTLDGWPHARADHEWWSGVREMPVATLDTSEIELKKSPFAAVSKVEIIDEDGTAAEWAASNWYNSAQAGGFGRLVRRRGASWPSPQRDRGGIVVTFTAGYGDPAAVPSALRHAVKQLVTHWYEKREPASERAARDLMPLGLGAIIQQYKMGR